MTTPLTREKVERMVDDLHAAGLTCQANDLEGYDAALRQTIAQQEQEIERLKKERDEAERRHDELAAIIIANKIQVQTVQRNRDLRVQLAAAQARCKKVEESKDRAYLERNHLVAALARYFPSGIRKTAIDGWSDDWHGCVYIDLPAGQISYHYHDSQAFLFKSLPAYTKQYDGHTKDDVHERLQSVNLQAALVEREERIKELERLLQGDLDVQRMEFTPETGLNLHASHPLMAAIAEGMVRFFHDAGGINYVELGLVHKTEGAYTLTVQKKTDAKTPHELRREAESDLAIARQEAARAESERIEWVQRGERAEARNEELKQDVARLREALELTLAEYLRIATANVKDWDNPPDAEFKAWAQNRARHTHEQAHAALKGV